MAKCNNETVRVLLRFDSHTLKKLFHGQIYQASFSSQARVALVINY